MIPFLFVENKFLSDAMWDLKREKKVQQMWAGIRGLWVL